MHLEQARGLHKEADRLIRAMYLGQVGWGARERARDQKLGAVFATLPDEAGAAALCRLVYGLPARGRLVAIEPVLDSLGPQAGNTGLDALLHFARFHERWLREPEDWMPTSDDAREQAGSLARHLFARYPLPPFLDAAWLSGFTAPAEDQRAWFVHLGGGGKLETIRFPMPMTHRAAHHFLMAPDEFTIPAAMRHGHFRALGGGEALSRAVAESFLADLQPDEPFWLSVIHFLVNHPEISPSQVGPILDYLRVRKFGASGDAPDPSFTMKGRTVDAIRKQMEEWHQTLARISRRAMQSWGPSGIDPLEKTAKDPLSAATCYWQVVELTDTLSLAEEGHEMRHCVRSYQEACIKGESSIWSLRLTLSDNPTVRRLLTIQVDSRRRSVIQVRGKCNQTLSAMRGSQRMRLARDVLREWARKGHLGLSCSL